MGDAACTAKRCRPGSVRTLLQGSVTMLPGFAEGQWWVQDAAAALPGAPVRRRRRQDHRRSLRRARRQDRAARRRPARASPRSIVRRPAWRGCATISRGCRWRPKPWSADAAEWPGGNDGGFDGILVDAPCTSTGTIRRHPDVAWLRQEADIARAGGRCRNACCRRRSPLLKPGGTLVYCTCSLEPEEGEQAIAALLGSRNGVRRAPIEAGEVAGLAEILTADGDLRTLPCHLPHQDPGLAGFDGFYAAGWLNPDFAPHFARLR